MGSNGAATEHQGMHLLQSFTNTTIILEPGSGGGCVETGPFSDMVVHVGPRLLWQYGTTTPLTVDKPTDDHPRCLKRDLNKHIASRYASLRNTTELILGNDNIEWFQAVMQGDDRYTPGSEVGVHGGGHYTIGGKFSRLCLHIVTWTATDFAYRRPRRGSLHFSWRARLLPAPRPNRPRLLDLADA